MKKYKPKRSVTLSYELMDSDAFKQLTAHQIRILLRFMQKRTWATTGKGKKKETIFNNGGLAVTYREAETLGIKTSSFHRGIIKLVELGFLDIEHQGGWMGRDYSRYSISERWKYYGTDSFKKVEKKRVLWGGHDVRSWQEKK